MNFPLFIARHLRRDDSSAKKVSRPAIRIATIGVAVGLAVMIISVCVVLGFKHTVRDKVIGFGSHIAVNNFRSLQENATYPIVMNDSVVKSYEQIEGVKHVQRFAQKQGILKTDDDFLGLMFKGIGPEYDLTFLRENMVEGSFPEMSDSATTNRLIISQLVSDKLNVHLNDRIYAYFLGDDALRTRRFTIVGIFETNMKQYDEAICFTDLYAVRKLNGWREDQASGAEVSVEDFSRVDEVEERFIAQVDRQVDADGAVYSSLTVKESNPQIFSWLDLLDLNVWIILGLMIAVSGFTMISGLLIIILERTSMIGVLKALGAKNRTIRHTFLWFAVFIIGKGMLIGNIIGIGLCALQYFTGMVKLDASTYYVSTVPVELNLPVILLINIGTLIVSVFVLVAPSYLISHIHPAKSMRYE